MADTKISALTAATAFADTDILPVSEAGVSKGVTGTLLKAWAGNVLNNFSTTSQAPAATVRTYITGSNISVPVGKLRIGTMFKWGFSATKTGAGSAASTIDIAVGTLGTTGDAARVAFTKPAGTAVIDEGWFDIWCVCRGPLSAAGVFAGQMIMTHNLAATGHAVIPTVVVNTVSAGFDVTTASLIVGLCITTGAADAITIQVVTAQAFNL